ncbi:MMPL family transporter [Nocardioides sp. DS6]|uniref:MMPL family transporter n=1 Tax=Nocardioides eburneus TaxID=3231482 RepID=A0ABV3T194_9ACTN
MASLLYRLGKTAYRRWPFFLVGWLLVILAVGGAAATLSKPTSDAFTIPGIPSLKAAELQGTLFDGQEASADAPSVTVVVAAPKGHTLREKTYAAAVADLVTDLKTVPTVPSGQDGPVGPVEKAAALKQQAVAGVDAQAKTAKKAGRSFDRAAALAAAQKSLVAVSPLSEDGRVGTIDFTFDVPSVADVQASTQQDVLDVMKDARASGLTVEAMGQGMQTQEMGGGSAEAIGILIALLILALTFGALVTAGMPIVTAVIGVGVGLGGITALTGFIDMPSTTTALASMIGLAVGIDYALFILARFRSELDHTDDRAEAMGIAVGTAGSAVVFAGLTVMIALAALSVVGIPFLAWMGAGAAATVLVAVLVALTLLPAILGMLKSWAFKGRFRRNRPKRDARGLVVNNGTRWAGLIGRAPLVFVLLAVVALGALAVPMKDLHLALPTDSTAAQDTTQRKAADLVTEAFGPGRLAPMLVVVDGRQAGDPAQQQAAYQTVTGWVGKQQGVANVLLAQSNDKGAMILVQPSSGPEDVATDHLLSSLRDGTASIERQTGTTIGITGTGPIQSDVSTKLSDALPVYLAIVIGLAFLLLMIVFRSLLVPLTATLGFLLSVLATLGATVLVFQKGTFGLFAGQPIVSFMPIFLVGVVFGLAMDYQVFLVTRIREAHVHGATFREAVVDGFRNSARVVTAAALIMTAVFSGFIMMDNVIIKSMGFALAVAVVFDAFVVRMLLIPALMYLMKEKAWYLPAWLDRILPNVDVEGESLHRPHLEGHWGSGDADPDERPELVDA